MSELCLANFAFSVLEFIDDMSGEQINKLLLVDGVHNVGKTRINSFFIGELFATENFTLIYSEYRRMNGELAISTRAARNKNGSYENSVKILKNNTAPRPAIGEPIACGHSLRGDAAYNDNTAFGGVIVAAASLKLRDRKAVTALALLPLALLTLRFRSGEC